jgi:PIN domain nuclease of toxin-antitoxin system
MEIIFLIVLDTHTWIWWLTEPERLSKKAVDAINYEVEENGIAISSVSVCELIMLSDKGRIELANDPREFIFQTEALAFVQFIPVDNKIFLAALSLPEYTAKDPADRIIIATANAHSAPLITKDELMRKYKHTRAVW